MKTGQGSFEYSYNSQAVVDAEYQVNRGHRLE